MEYKVIDLERMRDKLEKQLSAETKESLEEWIENKELIEKVMEDKAVTAVSGWTLDDSSDSEEDEEEYRKRLAKNASAFHQKMDEIFTSIVSKG